MLKARLVPISFLSLQIEKSKILKKNVSYITLKVSLYVCFESGGRIIEFRQV